MVRFGVELVYCEKMTFKEPGGTDEIQFEVTVGSRNHKGGRFDAHEGENIPRSEIIWTGRMQDGESTFTVHMRESDGAPLGLAEYMQTLGDFTLRIYKNGNDLYARGEQESWCKITGETSVHFFGAGGSYNPILNLSADVGGTTQRIKFRQ